MSIIMNKEIVAQRSGVKGVNKERKIAIHMERFDSVMEVADKCNTREMTSNEFHNMRKESLRSWHGVNTYDEAIDLMHNGYEPQVTMMELDRIARGEGKRIAFSNNIVGFAPVVPLALKGVPNCMIDMRMKPAKIKVIDLYYECTHSASCGADELIADGKKVLGAIMAMERSGYKINLYAMQSYANSDDCDMMIVKIKSSSQPFDLKKMSYALMHPAFFRVIGFDWYSKFPDAKFRFGYGHWLAREFNDKELLQEEFRKIFGNNAVYLSGMETNIHDQQYIIDTLKGDNK